MKGLLKLLIPIILIVIGLPMLFSCKSQKPENLTVDFWEASWDAVEGATEYVVELDGEEYRTENTYFELFEFLRPDERITVRVEPVFAGDKRKSLWTDKILYTAESVTEGLVYTELEDGTYAVSCPENVRLKNGKLVLPDTYEGAPIVELRNADNKKNLSSPTLVPDGKKQSDYSGAEATKIQRVRLPLKLETIAIGAFYKASLEKIYIPNSVKYLGQSAFEECSALKKVSNAQGLMGIGFYTFCGCSSLSDFTFAQGLVSIGSGAFIGTSITKAIIPEGVSTLEGYTFYNCAVLTEIELPESLDTLYLGSLDNTAWYNAQPEGVVYIGNFVYGYKGKMPKNTKLVIPSGITKMAYRNTFKNQINLVAVTLPEGFTEIQEASFYGCKNLSEVILPEGITTIQQGAFYGCKSLKEITLPESLETIYGGVFYGCGIERVRLPQRLTIVGTILDKKYGGAFENCKALAQVMIPSSVRIVGQRCFYGCTNLNQITIEDGVQKIRRDAFLYCSSLTELTIPDSVTDFEFNSIAYTGIIHFVFPKNIKHIPDYKPKYADGILLEYLVIQRDTKLLDLEWFYIYSKLKTFYFEGTKEEYDAIEKKRGQSEIYYPSDESIKKLEQIATWEQKLTIYYYSKNDPAEEGNYWRYVNGIPVAW